MFSRRAHWNAPLNRLTIERRRLGDAVLDLTESNPTRSGIAYPTDQLSEAMARASRATYDPDPRGLRSARDAVAAMLGCEADDILLTASTSEAYAFLFKLLTDPGDEIALATPSYPLLEHLAAMELVSIRPFPLEFHRRWEMTESSVRGAVTSRTRALVVVNPNNPTGSYVRSEEAEMLGCAGVPLISDEVFLDYPLESSGSTLARYDVPGYTLGGLSKSAGLPHFKLGWIRVSGPGKREALDALETIADNFLSVATPVQAALPDILRIAPVIRGRISQRTRTNLAALHNQFAVLPSVDVLPVEGGWSAVLRVPRLMSDEDLALALLGRGVLVQPGYFYDFDREGYLVVSLLTPEETFAEGVRRIAELVRESAVTSE